MSDLAVGDSVACTIYGITRIGIVDKIRPADPENQLYNIIVTRSDSSVVVVPFYRHELFKTYNDIDLDNQIKALTAL